MAHAAPAAPLVPPTLMIPPAVCFARSSSFAAAGTLALSFALLAGGCSTAVATPRVCVEPVFSYARDGIHPADAARLAVEAAEREASRAATLAAAAAPDRAWASLHPPRFFASSVR